MNFTTTLEDYKKAIKRKLHIPEDQDNDEWSNDLIIDAVAEARQELWDRINYAMRDGQVNIDTVIDQEEYDLSNLNIKRIDSVRYNDGTSAEPMFYAPLQDYLRLTETEESGQPYRWTLQKATLKVYPSPDAVHVDGLEIFCSKTLSELSVDADIDYDIENAYKRLVVRYSLGVLWLGAEQNSKANAELALFEKQLEGCAFDMNSETLIENNPAGDGVWIDETDERHYTRPIGS